MNGLERLVRETRLKIAPTKTERLELHRQRSIEFDRQANLEFEQQRVTPELLNRVINL